MLEFAMADRGIVIIKIAMRNKKGSCPNYRECRINEVRISDVSLYEYSNSSVGMGTKLRAGRPMCGGSIPGRGRRFFSFS
jgi:hypothetical protein